MQEAEYLVSSTDGITVSACPVLVDEQVSAKFMWGYYLCIENNTDTKIQLVGKDWNITDENGNSYNDSSVGFKGELPELEHFEFTAEAPLNAPNAVFYGCCKVLTEGQSQIKEIRIPTFNLSASGYNREHTIH